MAKIHDSFLKPSVGCWFGSTAEKDQREVGQVEYFNPASSVKDRISKAIIGAKASGELKPGGTVVRQLRATPVLHWHLAAQLVATRSS